MVLLAACACHQQHWGMVPICGFDRRDKICNARPVLRDTHGHFPDTRVKPSAIIPALTSWAQSQNLIPALGNRSEIGIKAEPIMPNALSMPCICSTFTNAIFCGHFHGVGPVNVCKNFQNCFAMSCQLSIEPIIHNHSARNVASSVFNQGANCSISCLIRKMPSGIIFFTVEEYAIRKYLDFPLLFAKNGPPGSINTLLFLQFLS